ncbi:MAG: hypothetical protein ACOC2W_02065 [bacterium]
MSDKFNELFKKLKSYETDDFQNRGGDYPKSNIPTHISVRQLKDVQQIKLKCLFKNTSEYDAKIWLEKQIKYKWKIDKYFSDIITWQDGDYHNDWVSAEATFNF